MKKRMFQSWLIAITVMLFSVSCGGDDNNDDPDTGNLTPGHCRITCTISGAASSDFVSSDAFSLAEKNSNYMNINGGFAGNSGTEMIMITLNVNVATGTYEIADQNDDAEFAYTRSGNGWGESTGAPFTIKVTSVTPNTIEGTFSGSLTNDTDHSVITVSNGKFAAKFI